MNLSLLQFELGPIRVRSNSESVDKIGFQLNKDVDYNLAILNEIWPIFA